MPLRKKPIGEDLKKFCVLWDEGSHEEKIQLAEQYGTSYDVAKHWRSDSAVECPAIKKDTERPLRMTVDDLLAMKPAINLDFVSFDIETSNLKADFSVLLTAVIKPFGCDPIIFRADDYKGWAKDRANDVAITIDIANELRKHAIVITHYGTRFDVPFLRAKMVHHGLEPLPMMFAIDTWKIARDNFQVSSRRLKNLGTYFSLGEKEAVDGGLWMQAAYNGDRASMDAIVAHNVRDCEVLEKLGAVSFPFLRSIPKL